MITADPVHWNVATDALVRAVVFDGLGPDHPAVRKLLEVLAPIAEAELAYRKAADAAMYQIGTDWDDEPEFPEQDGPVFLLGACVLVDAVWAAVGGRPAQRRPRRAARAGHGRPWRGQPGCRGRPCRPATSSGSGSSWKR